MTADQANAMIELLQKIYAELVAAREAADWLMRTEA